MNIWIKMTRNLAAILTCATAFSAFAEITNLPARTTPRPETTDGVPHVQIGVVAVPELTEELLRRVDEIPDVEIRDTVVSLPGPPAYR